MLVKLAPQIIVEEDKQKYIFLIQLKKLPQSQSNLWSNPIHTLKSF